MKHLREFLNRQIEVFLNHEFGPGMQNVTPAGIRRMSWTPEHTARLVGHLAGNWKMVEEALRVRQEKAAADTDSFMASHQRAMDKASPYVADPGEVAADDAQADAAAAEWDATPEGEKPPVNLEMPW